MFHANLHEQLLMLFLYLLLYLFLIVMANAEIFKFTRQRNFWYILENNDEMNEGRIKNLYWFYIKFKGKTAADHRQIRKGYQPLTSTYLRLGIGSVFLCITEHLSLRMRYQLLDNIIAH